jgi:hypothetical protein
MKKFIIVVAFAACALTASRLEAGPITEMLPVGTGSASDMPLVLAGPAPETPTGRARCDMFDCSRPLSPMTRAMRHIPALIARIRKHAW